MAWPVPEVPVAGWGGQVPEPCSAPPGPTDANEPTESVAWPVAEVPVAGADPRASP